MRLDTFILLACLVTAVSCGGKTPPVSNGSLSGNWQITLQAHGVATPFTYSGFLIQNGASSISGSLIVSEGCSGVGSVTGTVDGQNVTLDINQFGQDLNLTGTVASESAPMGGVFSTLAGGCTGPFTSTGTWTAVLVPPLSGSFTGAFTTTTTGIVPINVSGSITQGPNTGNSTATLSGAMTATNPTPPFCAYITTATITGTITGEMANLTLYGPDGNPIAQVTSSVAADAKSLSGSYTFPKISNSCLGVALGQLTLTFK